MQSETRSERTTPLLRMERISKGFPGVQALADVDLDVYPGECLALVGENGAGKSTLMKILSGVYSPDRGRLVLEGKPVSLHSPRQAQSQGIAIIYQEFNLMPNLSVAENVFVGREPNTARVVRRRAMHLQTRALLNQLGVVLRPEAIVRNLSVAQQQMVEIAKALSLNARIVIMDEPTSALSQSEVANLLRVVRELTGRGLGVIFITHRLDEVFAVCNRVVILRDGQNVGQLSVADATPERVVRLMVGRELGDLFQKDRGAVDTIAKPALAVRGLGRTGSGSDASALDLDGITFQVEAGEIVGLAGLVGSGRTEVVRAVFGADTFDRGEVLVDGERVRIRTPRDAIRAGIGLVPEDRKLQALILGLAVRENISLAGLGALSRFGFVRRGAERRRANEFVDALSIRTPSLDQKVVNLSGGNQQKVVIAKWLSVRPKVLIMDEPTRGIDIGAKAEVHSLMSRLAGQGVAILMISSELPEILGMSDRILVMREGRIAGELAREDATQEAVMALATGIVGRRSAA